MLPYWSREILVKILWCSNAKSRNRRYSHDDNARKSWCIDQAVFEWLVNSLWHRNCDSIAITFDYLPFIGKSVLIQRTDLEFVNCTAGHGELRLFQNLSFVNCYLRTLNPVIPDSIYLADSSVIRKVRIKRWCMPYKITKIRNYLHTRFQENYFGKFATSKFGITKAYCISIAIAIEMISRCGFSCGHLAFE